MSCSSHHLTHTMRVSAALATALLFAFGGVSTPVQPLGSTLDISDSADSAHAGYGGFVSLTGYAVSGDIPHGPTLYEFPSVDRRGWPPNDPIDHNSYCRRDLSPGTNLTEAEQKPLMECFDNMVQGGDWVPDWTLCNHTQRYFTAWGLWWKNPGDCYNAVSDIASLSSPLALSFPFRLVSVGNIS